MPGFFSRRSKFYFPVFILCLSLGACQSDLYTGPNLDAGANEVDVGVRELPLQNPAECENRFASRKLGFSNGIRIREINTYVSNGSGLAINDLDQDGDLDIAFGGTDRQSAIMWNQGGLEFLEEKLDDRFSHGVAIVDVNGDQLFDLVFSHRALDGLSYYRNVGTTGRPEFVRDSLEGVDAYVYAMAWGDLDRDGDLDLVTGSYNIELVQFGIEEPEKDNRAGVFYFEQNNNVFIKHRLSGEAEALSIGISDLNNDGLDDIWVANDFVLRDMFWVQTPDGLETVEPFEETSHSTMSIEWGDIQGNGDVSYFTTDMNPYDISVQNLALWLPVMEALEEKHGPEDPQIMANVMQIWDGQHWENEARFRGVDATGWSWSSKLGDLDNDGGLDLYITNGMIANNLFGHLPGGELIEENQAFRNLGDGAFEPAKNWGLGSTSSGRGMVMADMDQDGDLDIVINNLRDSAQLYENRLCGGEGLEVVLVWPRTLNTSAIGAAVYLETSDGIQRRDIKASGGYVSQDPVRVHFGFAEDVSLERLTVVWPDGAYSQIDNLKSQVLLEVKR